MQGSNVQLLSISVNGIPIYNMADDLEDILCQLFDEDKVEILRTCIPVWVVLLPSRRVKNLESVLLRKAMNRTG